MVEHCVAGLILYESIYVKKGKYDHVIILLHYEPQNCDWVSERELPLRNMYAVGGPKRWAPLAVL